MWFLTHEKKLVNLAKCVSIQVVQGFGSDTKCQVLAYGESVSGNEKVTQKTYSLTDYMNKDEAEAVLARITAKLEAFD